MYTAEQVEEGVQAVVVNHEVEAFLLSSFPPGSAATMPVEAKRAKSAVVNCILGRACTATKVKA